LWGWHRLPVRGGLLVLATLALTIGDLFTAGASFNASPLGSDDYYAETPLVDALQARRLQDEGRVHLEPVFPLILRRNAGVVFGLETALAGFSSPLRLAQTTPPAGHERVLDLMNVTALVPAIRAELAAIDPFVFLAAPVTMPGIALVWSYLPAYRASMVDPVESFRAD